MDQVFLQVFSINNEGVLLVSMKKYEEAIVKFTRLLEISRRLVDEVPPLTLSCSSAQFTAGTPTSKLNSENDIGSLQGQQFPTHSNHVTTDSNSSTPVSAHWEEFRPHPRSRTQCLSTFSHDDPHVDQCSDSTNQSSCDSIPCESGFHSGYIFQDPIEIPRAAVARTRLSQKLLAKISIVVLFNLALSFHLLAVRNQSWKMLGKAKSLYESAFEMHLDDRCDATLLYSLALLNNLGLIYKQFQDQERSSYCFESVLATMMVLLESNEAHRITQWDGLLTNVSSLICTEITAPGA